ncbi:MAG: DNA repair and recombination protein RadB [Archaeoglobaceae archaeon]|nr:DNA repair and recombination protein RadB [Archaeoglobaceae archaeon]MCX8151993.1 DNA repair and recombination protein RadB [Archaeoglobaceae archaeon]MDW8013382.1 DNA repair and recombination protein RadB [Archaeoglobaceae archaeon]
MLIPTGSTCIDYLIGGGVETSTITQFYGLSGTGKTTICLMIAKSAVKSNFKVAYVDTEGLSIQRVEQIFQDRSLFSNVYVYKVVDFKQQSLAIRDVEKLCNEVKVVVVDSFTALYRAELENDSIKAKRELTRQLTFLLGVARKHDVAVVITNQMFTDVESGEDRPLGGTAVEHLSKTIVSLEKHGKKRIARLIKHRWLPEGLSCEFRITDRGIEP